MCLLAFVAQLCYSVYFAQSLYTKLEKNYHGTYVLLIIWTLHSRLNQYEHWRWSDLLQVCEHTPPQSPVLSSDCFPSHFCFQQLLWGEKGCILVWALWPKPSSLKKSRRQWCRRLSMLLERLCSIYYLSSDAAPSRLCPKWTTCKYSSWLPECLQGLIFWLSPPDRLHRPCSSVDH